MHGWYGIGILYDCSASINHAEEPSLLFFAWIKVSLTPSLLTSCSFCFPSRFLMPFAGLSIEAGVDNTTTMWVKDRRLMNSVC